MNHQIRFACTALAGSGKSGIIKPDDRGYYDIVVGGLNVYNSVGQYYPYEEAKHLFEQSSSFMRRVQRGVLAGETGHPKWLPGMNSDEYAQRIMSIYEENVCCHHKEIYLDFNSVKDVNGQPIIAIRSKLIPAGPGGAALKASLDNPDENVCFSIRAFTSDERDHRTGTMRRILRTIVTWDRVIEPGLALAEKYKSPALESLQDMTLSRGVIERAMAPREGVATESALMTGQELFRAMGWNVPEGDRPNFLKW